MNSDERQSLANDCLILVLLQLKSVHYQDTFIDLHAHFVYRNAPFLLKVKLPFDSAHIMRNRLFSSIREKIIARGLPPGVALQWENMPIYKDKTLTFFSEMMREINLNKKRTGSRFIMSKDLPLVADTDLDNLPIGEDRLALELVLARANKEREAWSPIMVRLDPFIKLAPDNFELQLIQGQSKYALRNREEGAGLLRHAAENPNSDPEKLMEVSFWLYKNKDKDLAMELLEKPLKDERSQIFSRYLLAQIYYGFRDARFKEILKTLLEENPFLFSHYMEQAWDFHLKTNDLNFINLDEAAELLPDTPKEEVERLAYKGIIPSEYDVDTDELTFVKEEIEAWLDFNITFPGQVNV